MRISITFSTAIIMLMLWSSTGLHAQQDNYSYESSAIHPFGLPNPAAPPELLDFHPLIGECSCKSVTRIDQNTWGDTIVMTWRFKYIMNGMAVQDESLKSDGKHSGSIRQFIADSSQWYVHYYSSNAPSTTLRTWTGKKSANGDKVLYNAQKAPNGMDGFYKINFSDIRDQGFNWLGEWVSPDESFSYPTWKIYCQRDEAIIKKNGQKIIKKNGG